MLRKSTGGNNVWANTFGLNSVYSGIAFGVRNTWVDSPECPMCDYAIGSIECKNGEMRLVVNKELLEKFDIELVLMGDEEFCNS